MCVFQTVQQNTISNCTFLPSSNLALLKSESQFHFSIQLENWEKQFKVTHFVVMEKSDTFINPENVASLASFWC